MEKSRPASKIESQKSIEKKAKELAIAEIQKSKGRFSEHVKKRVSEAVRDLSREERLAVLSSTGLSSAINNIEEERQAAESEAIQEISLIDENITPEGLEQPQETIETEAQKKIRESEQPYIDGRRTGLIKKANSEGKKKGNKIIEERGITNQEEQQKIIEEETSKEVAKAEKAASGLQERYESEETSAEYVLDQISEYAKTNNAEYRSLDEEEGNANFDAETKERVMVIVRKQIESLFLSSDKRFGRFSRDKFESVVKVTDRYADLIIQSQLEGGKPVRSEAVLQKLQEIVAVLAYQDEVAAESLLGDHGVRHLVDHNIRISETLFDQLEKQGIKVSARDRLMMHEVMIYHDLGYATDPVRNAINKDGIRGQDLGHNVIASKIVRERGQINGDINSEIFSDEETEMIHNGILNHDSNQVDIRMENTPEARRSNFESFIHIADNTHAFEDKLPEVLYAIPDTLKTMYLMRIAAESGDKDAINELKNLLIEKINSDDPTLQLTDADKKGLTMAAQSITAESFKFSVGRICGNRPEVTLDSSGKVRITVQESEIHRETVGVFDMEAYGQLAKFVKDLTGKDIEISGDEDIDTDKIAFTIISAGKAGVEASKSDYQRNIENLINDPKFQSFRIEAQDIQTKIKGAIAREDKELENNLRLQLKNLLKDFIK